MTLTSVDNLILKFLICLFPSQEEQNNSAFLTILNKALLVTELCYISYQEKTKEEKKDCSSPPEEMTQSKQEQLPDSEKKNSFPLHFWGAHIMLRWT